MSIALAISSATTAKPLGPKRALHYIHTVKYAAASAAAAAGMSAGHIAHRTRREASIISRVPLYRAAFNTQSDSHTEAVTRTN